ncbi:MAG: hypothetical protein Q4D16_01300 [Eubacteriales bacterium]|nr:hypothetical protein [Eubacteriales bacterium]
MMKIKKITSIFSGFIGILIAGCLTASISGCFSEKEKPVVYVDEIPVYKQELDFAVQDNRLTVRNHIITDNHLKSDEFSWEQEYKNGQTPLDELTDVVLKQCSYAKLLQEESRKQGLLDNIDYPSIDKKRQEENKEREKRRDNNEVIYGIITYGEKEYYDYMNSNLELRLTELLSKEGAWEHSEDELEKLYQDNKTYFLEEPYEDVENSVKNLADTQAFEEYMNKQLDQANIKKEGDKLTEILLEAVS